MNIDLILVYMCVCVCAQCAGGAKLKADENVPQRRKLFIYFQYIVLSSWHFLSTMFCKSFIFQFIKAVGLLKVIGKKGMW